MSCTETAMFYVVKFALMNWNSVTASTIFLLNKKRKTYPSATLHAFLEFLLAFHGLHSVLVPSKLKRQSCIKICEFYKNT